MSLLTYNGVSLPYPLSTLFRQRAVAEDSDTDRIYTEFDITVQCVISSVYAQLLAPALFKITPHSADFMGAIRQTLLARRRAFSFKVGGVELIPQPQNEDPVTGTIGQIEGTVDAANGPKPQFCEITELTDTSFLLTYRITARYWENTLTSPAPSADNPINVNQSGNIVLSNRWTETIELDQAMYTTKTREGKFIIRSDNVEGLIADQLRLQMCALGVAPGFVRKSARYQQSPDGLSVSYRLTDQEVYLTPPPGAYEADGEFILNSTKNMAYNTAECWVRLRGCKVTNYPSLILAAMAAVSTKLNMEFTRYRLGPGNFLGGLGGGDGTVAGTLAIMTNMQIRVKLYDKEVMVRASGIVAPPKPKKGEKLSFVGFAKVDPVQLAASPLSPDDITGQEPPVFNLRGTVPWLLRAAAYWDPSLTAAGLTPDGLNMAQGLTPGQAGANKET